MFRILMALFVSVLLAAPALAQDEPGDIWAPEMDALGFLIGNYTVTGEAMTEDGWQISAEPTTATIAVGAADAGLIEDGAYHVPGFAYGLHAVYSYDGFREVYRVMLLDTVYGLMDIYEGQMDGSVLTLTNLRAGTSFMMPDGGELFLRIRIEPSETRHVFHVDGSVDEGAVWGPVYRFTYVRD